MLKIIGKSLVLMRGTCNRIMSFFLKRLFRGCGNNVRFDAFGYYSYNTITIGNERILRERSQTYGFKKLYQYRK
jgi:hypothetical protein